MARVPRTSASQVDAALGSRMWRDSGAARWSLSPTDFTATLERSVARRFGGTADATAVAAYLDALHASDLALAAACARGSDAAWEHFVLQFRPVLYRLAATLAGERGREIADGLYADLFGLEEREGQRRSLFDYYHGRSSLTTWLRSVLAQRVVDRARAERRVEPLPETDVLVADPPGRGGPVPDPHRSTYLASVRDALEAALGALDAKDRLRLAMYYLQGVKLAAIGRVLGESEATASRKLDRTRRLLRDAVGARLRAGGLNADQVALAFEYAAGDWPFDLGAALDTPRPP